MRKSICIIALSPIAHDARVLRQIKYLSPHYDLTVIGFGHPHPSYAESRTIHSVDLNLQENPTIPNLRTSIRDRDFRNLNVSHHMAKRVRRTINKLLLWFGTYSPALHETWYRRQPIISKATQKAIEAGCDAYLANDWNTLPMAAQAAGKNNAALVLDLHEYAPLQYMEGPDQEKQKRLITYTLSKYIRRVDTSITVAEPLAQRYQTEFGFYPQVIMNAPEKLQSFPHRKGVNSIKLFHHGIASRSRQPELMIETITQCEDRYSLHFMFLQNEYVEELKTLAKKLAPGRVFFHDPVPPEKITKYISQFDVGFYILPPTNYNNLVALPNKFLDFICSGLAVCIGPSPSMSEILNKYGLGVLCNTFDPEDMASVINQTSSEQWASMQQAARKASTELNAGNEMKKLINIFDRLL
jgi:glycosyltransferase involved in cell wall biosynthesis